MEVPTSPANSLPTPKADYDGAWKEAFELYLPGLTHLCFPSVAALIDWDAGFDFLDKDLEEIMRDADLGKQHVDKLIKIRQREGTDQLMLFHVEIASQDHVQLARTMYQYHHRLEDRFGLPVLSVAVLADDVESWRPHVYQREFMGCKLRFEFPICKLLDFRARWEELEAHPHPAAIIVMAHLRALESRRDMNERRTLRQQLTQLVYERGYDRKEVLEILRLLDWLLTLPKELGLAHRQWLINYEKEKAMPYVTSYEAFSREEGLQEGLKKGLQQGLQEGLRTQQVIVLKLLRQRLGELDEVTEQRVNELPSERMMDLIDTLMRFNGVADLRAWLQRSS